MDIDRLVTKGVENIIPSEKKLKTLLSSGKRLNVYNGIDPTSTKIHLGHAVVLRKLQEFVSLGHKVTFLIGDFTALIGDTSDKEGERPSLTYRQIQENFKTYKKQAGKILDFAKVEVRYNSEWLKKLGFEDVVSLCKHFSLGDFISRELIKKRLSSGKKISLHEVLYPVMQGYDSYFMDCDIQIGGADQTFNMQAGRKLQKDLRNKESYILVTDYLSGIDGRKMSKSWGNAIWLDDKPDDIFGKIMSLNDKQIIEYLAIATNTPEKKIETAKKRLKDGENPIKLKKELAYTIVKELYDQTEASKASQEFERIFQKGQIPTNLPSVKVEGAIPLLDLILASKKVSSKSEAKRLILQNAIEIDGKIKSDPTENITLTKDGAVCRIGKKTFIKFVS